MEAGAGVPADPKGFPRGRWSGQIRPGAIQINPNKSKQKGLDLLGYIRSNRDFSMGYGESK
jgi:hypothetical protein